MTHPSREIAALLRQVRNRWRLLIVLRASTRADAAAALVLGLALVAHRLLDPQGIVLIALWGLAIAAAVACVATLIPSLRRVPRDPQLARFIEERCPELEDVLATVISEDLAGSNPMAAAVADEAARRVQAIDRDRVFGCFAVRKAGVLSAAATLALVLLAMLSAGPAGEAMRLAAVYLFPGRLALVVAPGDVKVRAGDPLRVVATISGAAAVTPMLRTGDGSETLMEAAPDGFAFEFERVEEDFQYAVTAAGTTSPEYSVTVIRPPRVERIDLRYEYPAAFRMAPRQEEDGGDIYGPAGTRVHVTVHVDKPVTRAALNLTGGSPIVLAQAGDTLQGVLVIADDGSYRVALADADGLDNPGDTEYFIRTLQDSPPNVYIVRPASDRQVTPVEEVSIEARAEDDFGVAALDLVYTVGTGVEQVVPFEREGEPTAVSGRRTVYLEDLRVRPGDFVAYYARARDVSRGRRSTEARSDIFFLEVTPFEEEFVASQSQGAGSGGDEETLEDLIQQQKDIVTATWNLDRRSREAGGRSDDDIRAVGRAQRDVRTRAMATLAQMRRAADLRRRNTIGGRGGVAQGPDLMIEAIARAVEAMERARQQLEALKTADALPQEMTALNELLRAQAEVRRREVQQQASGQGGRGANRAQQDMSSLFDRELAKQQQTNYETPGRPQTGDDQPEEDDALEKIQELARRQDALNKSQQALAKNREATSVEELKRQLERLTREQSELRREAEELARQLQQGPVAGGLQASGQQNQGNQNQQQRQGQQGQRSQSGQSQQGQGRGQGSPREQGEQSGQGGQGQRQQASRELQQISEDMQGAASELRRDNPGEASARGSRAAERLRDLEQRMRSAQPDDRRRALGELQLESRQLADAQRRLTGEAGARGGTDPADRARRQAAEQERLADRTERLEEAVRQLAGASQGADPRERNALNEAVREIDEQRPSQQMRNAARPGQQGGGQAATLAAGRLQERLQASGEQIARALDRVGDRLGAASGQSEDSQRLTEELSRIRELREELAQLDRQLAELREQTGERPSTGAQAAPSSVAGRGGAERGRANEPGRGAEGGGVQNGDVQTPWQDARELLGELQRENRLETLAREADGFNPGRSAPGTEAWKQDFTKWDELKVQVAAALERAERTAADRLRDQQANDRLNAGATQAVPEAYRRLVEKYYRALAR
jgi:hypothetical protein